MGDQVLGAATLMAIERLEKMTKQTKVRGIESTEVFGKMCCFTLFFICSTRNFGGNDIQFDLRIFFQMGWFKHQLVYQETEKLLLLLSCDMTGCSTNTGGACC